MDKKMLYTIGHGNRNPEDFLALLKKFNIKFLIDVRSKPYSKFNPKFNQNDLKFFLEKNDIRYVFMGDSIGGRPLDPTCYDNNGKVDYEKLKFKDFFIQGIDRIKNAYNQNLNVILMCSESNPCECHRSKLIGKVLIKDKVILEHIDEKGKLVNQFSVIEKINKGLSEVDLFGNTINATSRKSYI